MLEEKIKLQPSGGWAVPGGSRVSVPAVKERGVMFRGMSRMSRFFGRAEIPNIFPVININRRVFWGWLFFASRLMPFGRLPAKTREKVILRVAWNCRSFYEWAQHLEIAQREGVTDDEILMGTKPLAEITDQYMRSLYAACDAMCAKELIAEEDWQTLAQQHSEKELIELLTLIGHYEMVAGILINANVPIEPSIENNFLQFQSKFFE